MEVVKTYDQLQQLRLRFVRKVMHLPPEKKHDLAVGYLQILADLSLPQARAILDPNGEERYHCQARAQLESFYLDHRLYKPSEPGTVGYDVWGKKQREFYEHARQLIPGLKESDLSPLTTFSAVATEKFVGIIAPDNPLLLERTARAFRWSEGAYRLGV